MSHHRNMTFDKSWEKIVEFEFSHFCCTENNHDTCSHEQPVTDYQTASAAASDICALISADTLCRVEKVHTKIREQVQQYLRKKVLPKVKRGKRQGIFLKVLSDEWHVYAKFKDWLDGLFSPLNHKIRVHGVFEDCDILETELLANSCFKETVIAPFSSLLAKELSRKYERHISSVNPCIIDADIDLLRGMTSLLKGISTTANDCWGTFRNWFVLHRERQYHRMASGWVRSLSFEDFVYCIFRHSEREKVAGETCFDREMGKALHIETKLVFFGTYLPKVFWKNKELYKLWVREEKINPLQRVNKALIMNGNLAKEITNIFRVSLLEKVCSTLNIDCAPFMANLGRFKSPFHVYCPTKGPGGKFRTFRHDVICTDKIVGAMLKSFGGHASLIKAFAAAKFLENRCERILQTYVRQCSNCILPSMLQSFCRSVLVKEGGAGLNSQIHSCHDHLRLYLKFVPQPDPFEKAYFEDLRKRLMENKLSSLDAELLILSAFSGSDEQGHIRQGARLLRNHAESQQLFALYSNSPFKHLAFQKQTDMNLMFRVNLFRRGVLEHKKKSILMVPHEISVCHRSYEHFFKSHHDNARLEWNHELSTVTIQTDLFSNGLRHWTEIELDVEQYSVLNLFQERNSLSLGEIIERVIIVPSNSFDGDQLLQTLTSIILSMSSPHCPILKKDSDTSALAKTDRVTLNTQFTSIRPNIKVPKPQYECAPQLCVAEAKPDNMRTVCTESAIVSVMKDLRRASREILLALVSKQVARFFKLDAKSFDDCMNRLIERDYITREDGLDFCYTYVL